MNQSVSKRRSTIGLPQGHRLRICHLGKFYPPASGGMETHVQTLARAQAERGADVQVICVNHLDGRGRNVTWQPLASTETVRHQDGPVSVIRLGRCASIARLDLCPGLPALMARQRAPAVDVLHLHVPNPAMMLALAAARPRLPLVVTYHSDIVRQRLLGTALRFFEHRILGRAASILSNSPSYPAGSVLLRRYAGKVAILPMGIDLQPYLRPGPAVLAQAERFRRDHGSPLWLTVGRLVYYKGLHHALQALTAVPGKLLMIGTGPLETELRQLARQLRLEDRIAWHGHASNEEVIGAYHAATALWFPSNARSEAFGLVQVEAMASGCPVINGAVPASGVTWVSRDDETGLTVPLNDSRALARAAQRLLDEPGLRQRLAVAARQRARTLFSHHVMAESSLAVYRHVLAGDPAPPELLRAA